MKSRTPARPLQIVLVDDHTIVREGLKRILESHCSEWRVSEASSAFQALDLMRTQAFDVAIVDLSMPGMSGLDLIRRIKNDFPSVAVLVLSMHAEEQYAMRSFKAGANGYVTKDSAAEELVGAVHKLAAGGAYVPASLAETMVQQLSGNARMPEHAQLSDRELEVLRLLVSGLRLTDIAEALHLSIKTVSTHKTRIQEKLGLTSLAALVRYGVEHGIDKGAQPTRRGELR